jgi:hypothetical protein
MKLLEQYLGTQRFKQSLKGLWNNNISFLNSEVFEKSLSASGDNLSWYFDHFIHERTVNDFKIAQITTQGDSLDVTLVNRGKSPSPVVLSRYSNDTLTGSIWSPPFADQVTITIPKYQTERLVINQNSEIPEINERNNYSGVERTYRRPVQLRLIQDVEDPDYRQIFMLPSVGYNLYDGLSLGIRWYNRTILPKPLHYNFEPQYALRSNSLVGGGSVVYNDWNESSNLFLNDLVWPVITFLTIAVYFIVGYLPMRFLLLEIKMIFVKIKDSTLPYVLST